MELSRPLSVVGAAGLAWALWVATGAASAAQTFTSRVDAVRVDVLVTDGGQPVEGLSPDDFEVYDNGVRQTVDLASLEEIPLNVVLALDMSASLQGLRLGHLQSAGAAVLDGLREGDRAALVSFSHIVTPGKGLTAELEGVRAGLYAPQAGGLTSLVDATHAAMLIGESDVGRSLVILFSDGVDTSSWLNPDEVIEAARRSDVVVYGVEVGQRRASFPRDLGEATGGRVFAVESTRDLSAAFSNILDEFRQRYLISYSPEGVSAEGWHRLDVRVRHRGATVNARPGYFAGQR